jgi:lysozyme
MLPNAGLRFNRLMTLTLIVLAVSIYAGYAMRFILFQYPGPYRFPVQGIDVSHHQAAIDWNQVAQAKLAFAFIKASEGGDFKDTRFAANWEAAGKIGLRRGAYHFFTLCRGGAEQASNFIATVPPSPDDLPPVVDLEFHGNCAARPSLEEFSLELQTFLAQLRAAYGREPILYTTHAFYRSYLRRNFFSQPLWIRDLFRQPQLGPNRAWTFWQYSSAGRIPGIHGPVDLNVFYGSPEAFTEFIEKTDRM